MRRSVSLLLLVLLLMPVFAPLSAQAAGGQELTVAPGDVIRLSIYRITRDDDLNGDFLIDENGVVTLPLIGEKQVAGLTYRELRTRLLTAFQEQLRNPSVTILPLRRVNVLGEVQRPNLYAIDPTVSLAGAIALAGGTTPAGNMNRIRIVRGGTVIRERVGVAESLSTADVRSGDQIVVEQRGWLARNSTLVVTALLSIPSVVSAIIIASRR